MDIYQVINLIVSQYNKDNPDIDGTGNINSQKIYLEIMKKSYYLTLKNCIKLLPNKQSNICELGAYLGIISKSLSHLGHNVIACDIPYFYDRTETKEYFKKSSVRTLSFNLRDYKIPIKDYSQDLVIACEIIEHLNFNPLPVIKEINRILKKDGFLYIATPNGDSFVKRIRYLIKGRQPSFEIKQFFEQLDSSQNMIVGLHWREYSFSELKNIISPFGFELVYQKLTSDVGTNYGGFLKKMIKNLIFKLPGCKPNQILLFKKVDESNIVLSINEDS